MLVLCSLALVSVLSQRDLAAISEQVEATTATAQGLLQTFPDAQEHIASKHEEMVGAWNALLAKAQLRKQRLHQADSVQSYFDDYRGLWSVAVTARHALTAVWAKLTML